MRMRSKQKKKGETKMKKRILILALALAVIMNTMPVFAMTEADETSDAVQTAVQQEEMIEEMKEEPSAEAKAEEESPQKAEAETETAPAENNDQVSEEAKPEAQEQEKTETTTPDAEQKESRSKKTLGSGTAAETLKVVWHFNILGEDGEYKEVKAYTQSVKSGAKTTNIALTTATSYVKPSSVVVDGKTYNYVTSWKDANGNTIDTAEVNLYRYYDNTLKITKQPGSYWAVEGQTMALKIEVSGGKAPYSYQWEYNEQMDIWEIIQMGAKEGKCSVDPDGTLHITVSYYDWTGTSLIRCVVTDANGNKVISDSVDFAET